MSLGMTVSHVMFKNVMAHFDMGMAVVVHRSSSFCLLQGSVMTECQISKYIFHFPRT